MSALAPDLGRKAKVLKVEGFVVEPGHIAKAKALIDACEKPGPGTLTHPWLGDLNVIVTECRVRFAHAEGGMAAFSLSFAEAGESIYPAPEKNAAGIVDRAAATAKSAIGGRLLQNFTLDKVAGWVADSAGGVLKDAFTSMGPSATHPSLRARIMARIQAPPHGGNADDYEAMGAGGAGRHPRLRVPAGEWRRHRHRPLHDGRDLRGRHPEAVDVAAVQRRSTRCGR